MFKIIFTYHISPPTVNCDDWNSSQLQERKVSITADLFMLFWITILVWACSLGDQHLDCKCCAFLWETAGYWSRLRLCAMVCLCTLISDYSPYSDSVLTPDSTLNRLRASCPSVVCGSERSCPAWSGVCVRAQLCKRHFLKFNATVQTCCFSSVACLWQWNLDHVCCLMCSRK